LTLKKTGRGNARADLKQTTREGEGVAEGNYRKEYKRTDEEKKLSAMKVQILAVRRNQNKGK